MLSNMKQYALENKSEYEKELMAYARDVKMLRRCAWHVRKKFAECWNCPAVEELMSVGFLHLLDQIRRYEPRKGTPERFAVSKILFGMKKHVLITLTGMTALEYNRAKALEHADRRRGGAGAFPGFVSVDDCFGLCSTPDEKTDCVSAATVNRVESLLEAASEEDRALLLLFLQTRGNVAEAARRLKRNEGTMRLHYKSLFARASFPSFGTEAETVGTANARLQQRQAKRAAAAKQKAGKNHGRGKEPIASSNLPATVGANVAT